MTVECSAINKLQIKSNSHVLSPSKETLEVVAFNLAQREFSNFSSVKLKWSFDKSFSGV